MPAVGTAIYLVALAVVVVIAVRRGGESLIYSYTFFVPWFGIQANIGLTLNIDRFIAAIVIAWAIATRGPRAFAAFGVFLAYILTNTVAHSIVLPVAAEEYPPLQGQYRWVFQLFMWTLLVAPGAVIAARPAEEIVRKIYRTFVVSAGVLAGLAILQCAVYYSAGVDLFPIGFMDPAGSVRSAAFESGDAILGVSNVFRAGSLAGEPKHLAISLALALAVIAAQVSFGGVYDLSSRTTRRIAVLCVIALIMTFSTQGIILVLVNVGGVIALSPAVGGASWARYRRLIGSVAIGASIVLCVPGLGSALRERTVGRIAESGAVEDWNQAVIEWLKAEPEVLPLGVGLGNVHLHAAQYIPNEFLRYMRGKVFVAKSGLLRIVSEMGLVGLGLFLAFMTRAIRRLLAKARRGNSSLAGAHAVVTGLAVLNFLLSADGPVYVFLLGGMAGVLLRDRGGRVPEVVTVPAVAHRVKE